VDREPAPQILEEEPPAPPASASPEGPEVE